MTLDVIVVAYHSGAVLDDALAGLSRFAEGGRIIVVDNSPDDPSAADVAAGFPTAQVLAEPENVGFAAAVNDAFALATADIVLLANPDIRTLAGSVDDVLRIFATNAVAGAVAVRLLDGEGRLQHCRRRFRRFDLFATPLGLRHLPSGWVRRFGNTMSEWDHSEERMIELATGALLFIRRAAFEDVGPFDEQFFMYWEETDWLERARAKGWQLIFTPAVGAVHAVRGSSDSSDTSHSVLLLESTHKYARKHFGRSTALALRTAWILGDLTRLAFGALRPSRDRREELERLRFHLGFAPAEAGNARPPRRETG
jgi:N-acetylglucosaminyl-diphospho-decaprenol L-rhamnosyltransferase